MPRAGYMHNLDYFDHAEDTGHRLFLLIKTGKPEVADEPYGFLVAASSTKEARAQLLDVKDVDVRRWLTGSYITVRQIARRSRFTEPGVVARLAPQAMGRRTKG